MATFADLTKNPSPSKACAKCGGDPKAVTTVQLRGVAPGRGLGKTHAKETIDFCESCGVEAYMEVAGLLAEFSRNGR